MAQRPPPPGDEQQELFAANFSDILTRDAQDCMCAPFVSLSKRPRFDPIMFENGSVSVTVSGGRPWGIANIWDWDLMMWLLSNIREGLDKGEEVSPRVKFHRHSFLKAARRGVGGAQYRRLEETITRLKNTHVRTSIRAANGRTEMFNWIESASIERDHYGAMSFATVTLPDWIFRAVCDHRLILCLHRDYYLLTGGYERWLYRTVRKSAGRRRCGWQWTFRTLHERSASPQRFSDFARQIRRIVSRGTLLDYEISEGKADKTREPVLLASMIQPPKPRRLPTATDARNGPVFLSKPIKASELRFQSGETYEEARQLAPGYDIYRLEAHWRKATMENRIRVKDPDAMFLRWCAKVAEANPAVRSSAH